MIDQQLKDILAQIDRRLAGVHESISENSCGRQLMNSTIRSAHIAENCCGGRRPESNRPGSV